MSGRKRNRSLPKGAAKTESSTGHDPESSRAASVTKPDQGISKDTRTTSARQGQRRFSRTGRSPTAVPSTSPKELSLADKLETPDATALLESAATSVSNPPTAAQTAGIEVDGEESSSSNDGPMTIPSRTSDAELARAQLRKAAGMRVEGCKLEPLPLATPLEACARHKVLAVQQSLDALAEFEHVVLVQLETTRDALLVEPSADVAEIRTAFDIKAAGVTALAATKRADLEQELVNADVALEEALGATSAATDAALLGDADVVACSAALLFRLERARGIVAAVPDVPCTVAYVGIDSSLHASATVAGQSVDSRMGTVTGTPPPSPHVHTYHCSHPARLTAPSYATGRIVGVPLGVIDTDFTLALIARPMRRVYSMLASKDRACVAENQFRLEMYRDGRVGLAGLGIPGGVRYTTSSGDSMGYSNALTSSRALPLNAWTHVAVSRAGGSYTLYFDGSVEVAVDVGAHEPGLRHDNALDLRIGSRYVPGTQSFPPCDPFNGDIIDAFYTPEYINAPDIALIARDAHRTVGTDFGVGAIVGSISARAATPTGMACSSVLPLSKAMSGTAHLPSASPGRFRCLRVIADMSIRDFVAASGAVFAAGRGFYELSKPEDVSRQKEVIVENLSSGEFFTGADAKALIGLLAGEAGKVKKKSVPAGYRAFIQSTSFTRKLVAGTMFLYEASDSA